MVCSHCKVGGHRITSCSAPGAEQARAARNAARQRSSAGAASGGAGCPIFCCMDMLAGYLLGRAYASLADACTMVSGKPSETDSLRSKSLSSNVVAPDNVVWSWEVYTGDKGAQREMSLAGSKAWDNVRVMLDIPEGQPLPEMIQFEKTSCLSHGNLVAWVTNGT